MPQVGPACDVLVVGAGPAGATAALLLARNGRHVTLVDRAHFPRDKACGDLVGSFAIATLQSLAIDLDVVRDTPPLQGAFVHAPSGRSLGANVSARTAARLGARVIRRHAFDAALVAEAVRAGATLRHVQAAGVLRTPTGAIGGIHTADGDTLRAALTIGADGWSSSIARAIVREPRAPHDAGIAVRAYVRGIDLTKAMNFYVGARGDGYGWIFPLADGAANVGLGFVRDEFGARDLHAAFARFLSRPEFRTAAIGPPRTWPIPFGWRGTAVSTAGALLAGDAASLASSLSGSGIHTAIASGAIAARVATEALARNDLSARSLAVYDRRLGRLANRLRFERTLHAVAGTPAGSDRAIRAAAHVPGLGRLAVNFFLNLG